MLRSVFCKSVSRLALGLVLMFGSSIAVFAEIDQRYSPWIVEENTPKIFILSGEINDRTSLNFERALEKYGQPSLLALSSPGGLVNEALVVAKRAHEMGVNTLIPEGEGCYSACSLIFLAGKVRIADGDLGVHQISSKSNDLSEGQVAISDILDVIGHFDVPNDLMVDMFRTPPDEIYIVPEDEKIRYGFFLRAANERTSSGEPSLEERAAKFLIDFNLAWSQENSIALGEIETHYGDSVEYFGKSRTHAEVMDDKASFADRWPIRRYTVDGSTVTASCRANVCTVTGNIHWHAESPARGKISDGVASSRFVLSIAADRIIVLEEDGVVLSRS